LGLRLIWCGASACGLTKSLVGEAVSQDAASVAVGDGSSGPGTRLAPVFAQARSRLTAFGYIGALLAVPGDRRSCWQPGEQAGHALFDFRLYLPKAWCQDKKHPRAGQCPCPC
jgi:hypothetical protein